MLLQGHLNRLSKGFWGHIWLERSISLETLRSGARWRGWRFSKRHPKREPEGMHDTIPRIVEEKQEKGSQKPVVELWPHSTVVKVSSPMRRLGTWYQDFQVKPKGEKMSSEMKFHPRKGVRNSTGEEDQLWPDDQCILQSSNVCFWDIKLCGVQCPGHRLSLLVNMGFGPAKNI